VKEHLKLKLKDSKVFRVSRIFEELRLKMENLPKRPTVYVALYGEYSTLNARLNFVKNYFELLGLTVHEPGHSEMDLEHFKKDLISRNEDIIVFCALDDQYPNLIETFKLLKTSHQYIAGKFEASGVKNLFAGQNVHGVLENLVEAFTGRKS
jgi:ABC-type Fe3+-hydroxamate transport system substrate-binding protein